jgi:hypothetical protein
MTLTESIILDLKQGNQDFEWYPTTDAMIFAIRRLLPEDADSIMDIGAGDGRVLEKFGEKCKFANLYSIELSTILVQKQSKDIIPIGTNLFEQNLSCLSVDYIFCNPPYSEYEEWVCKIVSEGYAKKAFLIIPQRWKESKIIEKTLKLRNATTRVIYNGNFENADRQARAVIDIVEISYPKDKWDNKTADPFDIWFDQNIDTFDKAKEIEKDEESEDLAKQYANSNIGEMVDAYREEYGILESNYRAVFKLDYAILHELGINKDHVREGLKKKLIGLKVKYWQILFERLDVITSRLTTDSKDILLKNLTRNTSVEFTATNAYSVVLWAIKNANQYFDDQAIDLFHKLSNFEGVLNYKSNVKTWEKDGWRYGNTERKNTHYALDYRIVVSQYDAICKTDYKWDYPNNLSRSCHDLIADVIAVMSNLGFKTYDKSFNHEWVSGKWRNFYETNTSEIMFQVKAHMNGNLHFRFMPDAIKALNVTVGRLLKWLRTESDVITELGYSPHEAKKFFNCNSHILPSNIKLLENRNDE